MKSRKTAPKRTNAPIATNECAEWIADLKKRYRATQIKAADAEAPLAAAQFSKGGGE